MKTTAGISTATAVQGAADRVTDAALAKATAKLASDRKTGASGEVLRADQKAVTQATKAATKADEATGAMSGKLAGVSLTA